MYQKPVIIYGTSNFSRVSFDEIRKKFEIVCFCADSQYIKDSTYLGLPLYDIEEMADKYPPNQYDALLLRSHRDMRERSRSYSVIKLKGYKLVNYIGDNVHIDNVKIGEGNLIFSNVYLGAYGNIGNNNIIRPNCYIGHDFVIGDHNYISPGCNIAGYCTMDDGIFIGIGSVVIDNIRLRTESGIGAGSLVLQDTDEYSFYVGHPCRKTTCHKERGMTL